jgi:hypothetical protein
MGFPCLPGSIRGIRAIRGSNRLGFGKRKRPAVMPGVSETIRAIR